jgi:hypothetical protein
MTSLFHFLLQLARRAGVPDGVINVVTTEKNVQEVGKEMCESKVVRKVTFTGSTRVAKLLYGMAASTLKKCVRHYIPYPVTFLNVAPLEYRLKPEGMRHLLYSMMLI